MISSREFDVISLLQNDPQIDEEKYAQEIQSLFSEKLINFNVIGADPKKVYYTGYTVTPKGQRAYEEFISFQTIQKSNTESLNVAKEANMLSAKANELSAEANLISKDAKRLSFWAIVISAIAAGISIVGIIVSALT